MLLRALSNHDGIYYIMLKVVQDVGIYQEQHIYVAFKMYFTVKMRKKKKAIQ